MGGISSAPILHHFSSNAPRMFFLISACKYFVRIGYRTWTQTRDIILTGRKVNATVVDECDSTMGCDSDHDFQPPCPNHVVDASKAVWQNLGVPTHVRELDILWSDA